MNRKITAIIEKDEYGYFAYCPELKGCHTQGDTFEEAYSNLKEAADLYLEKFILTKWPISHNSHLISFF